MGRLWDYCAFCGKRIETGEKCYGLPNGESVCTDCCVEENEGAAVSDGEEEQENTMAEYIEREALKMIAKNTEPFNTGSVFRAINRQIAADVAPVVRGRWEWLGPNRLVTDCMCGTCSACKVRSKYIVNTMLCPNCGAKMDGEP